MYQPVHCISCNLQKMYGAIRRKKYSRVQKKAQWTQAGSKEQNWGLGHHYGGPRGCGYEAISIQIIDQVEFGDALKLAECELYWQSQLRCFVENGGGAHCYRKDKM